MRKAKKKSSKFVPLVTDYFQFAEQDTLNCYEIGLKTFEIWHWLKNIRAPAVCRNATSKQAITS